MAVTAFFDPAAGVLTELGDNLDNTITTSRNAAGNILINGGAVAIQGGTPTVANTSLIQVFGQGGNDTITLDESNGALPAAQLFGGAGNDTLTGGSGGDMLFGQSGDDILLGKGGNDFLFGGDGNDTLIGGDGDDQMFGEAGDDRMIWNPGDDTDLMEGGAGIDTAEVNGGNGAEVFTVTPNGARVRFDRLDPAPFSLDIGTTETLVLNMNGGDDTFIGANGLSALTNLIVDGGAGNDTIIGGDGGDSLFGGDGDDFIAGRQGNDVAFLGAGDDVFQWDPGDGSDIVEGGDGTDTLLFNGSAGAEIFEVSANGGRVRFTRDLGNIVMDLDDMERIDLTALGNTDTITVNDLTGTDLVAMNINLAGTIGGAAGDGAADTVIANGTNGDDIIDVVGAGTSVSVLGLAAQVNVLNAEGANDSLVISALGGNDGITATTLPAGVMKLTIDGGAGNDTILGSQGADVILGGDGDDFVLGDNGNDIAVLGAGNDVFQWNPGDGSDIVVGGDGVDTLLFFGANIAENINIAAIGGLVFFSRDVANVTMVLDDTETIDFKALGGADTIVVNDLSGTDVTDVKIDLAFPSGSGIGDGATDLVIVVGTTNDDVITVSGGITVSGLPASVVSGLPASVEVSGSDATDQLAVNAGDGNDVIDASGFPVGQITLILSGGAGADLLIGSPGNDFVSGGTGADTALLGAGDDFFVWSVGDGSDIVEGQAGFDQFVFIGSNANENIDISANGGRVRVSDVANAIVDLDDVEAINVNALDGTDTVTVNDLSGTDATEVNINLAGTLGGSAGDGQVDTIFINGTESDDVILIAGDASGITILGLAAQINISGFDANDQIVINGLGGDDVIDASGLAANVIQFTANGGDGGDVLIGSPGNDTLRGEAGDDVLVGGGGVDVLDGGPGDNVVLQGAVASLDPFII